MSSGSPSAALAESIAALSRTAHQAIADVESRSRIEVANAVTESNETRSQRDKAMRERNAAQKEAQAWKEEANASKAALGQAELTIAHQAETLAQQSETIAQLRRELNQWKDQSRDWQDHFLRVEQDRCALSSRLDELASERLQWTRAVSSASSLVNSFTPQSRYDGTNSTHNSSTPNKRSSLSSPTQKSTVQSAGDDSTSTAPKEGISKAPRVQATNSRPTWSTVKARSVRPKNNSTPSREEAIKGKYANLEPQQHSAEKKSTNHKPIIRSSTVIRRVQAVFHVKREEDSEDDVVQEEVYTPRLQYRRNSRRLVEDQDSDQEEPPRGQKSRSLRPLKAVQYQEEDDNGDELKEDEGESSEEDELTMGNENRNEVPRNQRSRAEAAGSPANKRRKVDSNVT